MTLMFQIAGGILLVPVILLVGFLVIGMAFGIVFNVVRFLCSRAGLITVVSLVAFIGVLHFWGNYLVTGDPFLSPCGPALLERRC